MYLVKKKVPNCLLWEKPYITLVYTSKIKPYRVYVVWVIMSKKPYTTKFLHVVKLRADPEYSSTPQMLRISYFWPDWNSYVRPGAFHTMFSAKMSHSYFPKISVSNS